MTYNGARPKEKNKSNSDRKVEIQNVETKHPAEEESRRFYRHLSVRLYDVLDHVCASKEFRKLHQDCAMSREIIDTIGYYFKPKTYSCFIFGSSSEGTTTPGLNSDTDILYFPDVPVIDNIRKAGDGVSLLMVSDKHTQPGYVKLQIIYNGQPQTVNTRAKDPDTQEFDSEGRICLKHVSVLGKEKVIHARNGPADTNTDVNIDFVQGFKCSTIPAFAKEWIGRDRQYKWPTKRMLDKMATIVCFVVGVGHPASEESNIEWRLSFSLQERELMFSMNTVQHKCYIVLKMIKNDLLVPYIGKSLSSYHLKTCMLYVIENTKLSLWKKDNLTQCVELCLIVLFKWVFVGFCPNYFIKEENMFDRNIHRTQRFTLLQHMHSLLYNGVGFLFRIKLDQVGLYLRNGVNNEHTNLKQIDVRFLQKIKLIHIVLQFRKYLCCKANEYDNNRDFLNIIFKYVSKIKFIQDHSKQQTLKALSYILPFVNLQLAQSYASLAFITNTTESKRVLLQNSCYHLRDGRHGDLTSATLLEVTFFYKLEQYERCIGILDQLEQVMCQNSLPICQCYLGQNYYSKEYMKLSPLPVSEILAKSATCLTFLRSNLSITPEALQYEMFRSANTPPGSRDKKADKWFDMAVVDAVVYLYFLQYLAHAKLNRRFHKHVAIKKLESMLKHEEYLGHRETGYNLLGWIHFQENWIPQGIKYFQKSWSIRPHHNEAKLHLLKLI